jgi:hypothetical protein
MKRGVLIIRENLRGGQSKALEMLQAILALHRNAKPDPFGPGEPGDNNPKFKLHR